MSTAAGFAPRAAMLARGTVFALAATLASLAGSGCSKANLICGPGTRLVKNVCLPAAPMMQVDAGPVESDAGVLDSGAADSGAADSGAADSGAADSGGGDSGSPDAAGGDAGAADAGSCLPYCVGMNCGNDGCGGSCGTCSSAAYPTCNTASGICVATCTPACSGLMCGDDGCGGSCGMCAANSACSSFGQCVPSTWTCAALAYGADGMCECGCGAPDPDCRNTALPMTGCSAQQTCNSLGVCVSSVPAAWTCAASLYDDHAECHCGCGAPDPDCSDARLRVVGCSGNVSTCNADGTCPACMPSCTGLACGPNGCGGSCGTCADPTLPACVAGACVSACSPVPLLCQTNVCGDDGCGGTCGTCATGQTCTAGGCVTTPPPNNPLSCHGYCGGTAPDGCGCAAGCVADGTCCSDYAARCVCTPSCTGLQCGDDGCGGSCGSCSGTTPHCSAGQCVATCTPQCSGLACGDDGCGGSCGTCASGAACAYTGQCLPSAWFCAVSSYGTSDGCNCGCGAPDPDCKVANTPVFNCPTPATACSTTGLCAVTFCSSSSSCGGELCSGAYYEGGGLYAGVCAAASASGLGAGDSCTVDSQCSSGVCAGSLCRAYCAADTDCAVGQLCAGMPVGNPASGYDAVCESIRGSLTACAAQSDCTASGEKCIAVVNPSTLKPRYVCAKSAPLPSTATSCNLLSCPSAQMCVPLASGSICSLPCPGGAADCPSGWTCGSTFFNDGGAPHNPSSGPMVPVCVPI